ncbi:3-oxoacyl-[acyl-carrier-protein] reductase [Schnuerera sp. xch1]|uniref:3-oxoacyl-[acyl-carrier-protein] reductase n=1 Tax=Schnuerera sp. xch1 TaxID=2874283 RepID=UPI001CBE8C50|nr:3-oxoacyl-[acyl-carrier-protein] reductase [Schnuerera sp. xch1]MBZ2175833.1 3-oxoacyl-[acyl-carrier-protein] reductase [Schnuerera sp. xch1]
MSLTNKNALVTGGSRGIGREIAIKLSENGVNVAISYIHNIQKAQEVVNEIEKNGVKGMSIKADVSKEEDVAKMLEVAKDKLGDIDILVNNAGITKDNLIMRMKTKEWDEVINTNLRGTYLCTKSIIRGMMKKRYGKIINIASVAGVAGNFGQGNYSASKAGVIGFTKSMAKELASRGINVNAVAPGLIETDMTKKLKEDIKDSLVKNIPMGRLGTPHEIANIVVFLASEKSDYITGQVINVDGGMIM